MEELGLKTATHSIGSFLMLYSNQLQKYYKIARGKAPLDNRC